MGRKQPGAPALPPHAPSPVLLLREVSCGPASPRGSQASWNGFFCFSLGSPVTVVSLTRAFLKGRGASGMEEWAQSACKVRQVFCNVRMRLRRSGNFFGQGLESPPPRRVSGAGAGTHSLLRADTLLIEKAVARGGTRIPEGLISQADERWFSWLRSYPFLPPSSGALLSKGNSVAGPLTYPESKLLR